ncbi:hypothetical protein [Mesorhizobium sp. ISC15]|uniref:hypothetical protein n=1 Tax=Mesorhizobium sp. ISC15 TaxID=3076429 RepID=UPI00301B6CB3
MTSVARGSFEAWSRLCAAGGLELDDRDADFGENLRIALSPSAATLEEALRSSSTDHLVRAVFDLAEPFVAMFRAILSFFQAAGVQQGRSQWDIHIEEDHFELKHFEKFLETWNALDCEVDVPAVDSDGASAILRAGDDLIDAEWRAKTGVPDAIISSKCIMIGDFTSLSLARSTPIVSRLGFGMRSLSPPFWLTAFAVLGQIARQ